MDTSNNFFTPQRIWSVTEVLNSHVSPIPKSPGVYFWCFQNVTEFFPTGSYITIKGFPLLYIGIAPSRPFSKSNLKTRIIKSHLQRDASRSTLRLSLGCLLSEALNINLKIINGRYTFGNGEKVLSEWIKKSAYVFWVEHPEPWQIEEELIHYSKPPLNLEHNQDHPFYLTLSFARDRARKSAGQ
jgi:hypothetical protein